MAEEQDSALKKRYYTIGEVSKMCGVKLHVLRYWEKERIPKLIPVRRQGRRYYQPEHVVLVQQIKKWTEEEGYSLEGVRQKLNGRQAEEEKVQVMNDTPRAQAIRKAVDQLEAVAVLLRD